MEMEDNLLQLDKTIASLLKFVDENIGIDNTLIVLSADHGGPEAPGRLHEIGVEAEYIDPKTWHKEAGIAALKQRFEVGSELIKTYFHPYIYLDHAVIREQGINIIEVQEAIAAEISKLDGVKTAIPSSSLVKGEFPNTALTRAILNNHYSGRSGDVFVVFKAHRFISDMEGLKVAVHHGSPWSYDTFVPLIFAGNGIKPSQVYRLVHTVDVAPTLAAWLGSKPPSGASGHVLPEVLVHRPK